MSNGAPWIHGITEIIKANVSYSYMKVLISIDLIRSSVDRLIGKEQCGFREGRGCVDQIFAVRQLCKKYLGVNR